MESPCLTSEAFALSKCQKRTFQYDDVEICHRASKRMKISEGWQIYPEEKVHLKFDQLPKVDASGSAIAGEIVEVEKEEKTRAKQPVKRNKSSKIQSLLDRLSRKFPLRKPLRTPYYVPANAREDIDEFITRKPTRPMKVISGKVMPDRRREYVPRQASSVAPLRDENTMEDLIMPTVCRMYDAPRRKVKEQFLMPQFTADRENLLSTATTKSAGASRAKKPGALTKKALSHFFAYSKVPSPARAPAPTSTPANAAQPPLKMTFQIIPGSSLDADGMPVEYFVNFTV
jgi:hypothetical protein